MYGQIVVGDVKRCGVIHNSRNVSQESHVIEINAESDLQHVIIDWRQLMAPVQAGPI